MSYVPEDGDWDRRIGTMMTLRHRCKFCKKEYLPIQNVGAWKCAEQKVYSFAEKCYLKMLADHVPRSEDCAEHVDTSSYTEGDDFPMPSFVYKYFAAYTVMESVLPAATVQYQAVDGQYHVYDAVVVRRFDFRTKQRADKYWPDVEPTGCRSILPKQLCF